MYILSCAHSDFCSLPVCLWKVGVLHDSFCSWSRGPGRARGTRCSAFAESWGVIASAAERCDPTLMQPLLSGSAFTLSFATLAVLDLYCECVAVEHGHIERQVKLILQLADGVPDQEIFPATLETAHDDGLLISKPCFEEVHILKHTICLHQRWKNERSLHRRKRHIGPSVAVFVAYELRSLS